jgi:membrane associated rhomboid family serine protease
MSLTTPDPNSTRGKLAARWEESANGAKLVVSMLAVMWVVWIINAIDNYGLNNDGIISRNVGHLWGIFTAPFIHLSFGHILGNSIPFLILGLMIAGSGLRRVAEVTLITIVIGGLGVWLVCSSHTVTDGASGLVFGYATYLIARGFVDRKMGQIVVGVIVGALFGLTLLWDLVPKSGVSWQGHLFGGIAGVIAAFLLSERRKEQKAAAI